MPEAEVLYSDVKFIRAKREVNEAVFSSADTTYSEVKISKTQPSTTELAEGSQQVVSSRRSKVTSERVALLVLSALLAAAVIALCVTTFHNMKKMEELKKKWETEKQNLTEQLSRRPSETKCSMVQPSCPPGPKVKNESCYKCEEGWEQHGGKCYYFSTSKSSWNESTKECRAKGGDLVKIDSREEQTFLERRLREKMTKDEDKFWIGLTDSAAEGRWLWVDGSPLNESFWSNGEPDNWKGRNGEYPDGEDCVRMGEKAVGYELMCWFDKSCTVPHRSICEKPGGNGQVKYLCI